MNMEAALERHKPTRKGPRCTMCQLLDDLPPKDRQALQAALDDPTFTHAAISRAIREEGPRIGQLTVGRHRKGECAG